MRHGISHSRKVTGHNLIAASLAAMAALLIYQQASSSVATEGPQVRRQQSRILSRPKTARAKAFGLFKHKTHTETKKELKCFDCHSVPAHLPREGLANTTRTGLKTYPYHDKCLDCHDQTRPQFFRGATPAICRICHTRSSPLMSELNPFPKQGPETILGDLSLMFRHEKTHMKRGCTDCHKRINQLDFAKADVEISTCAEIGCHSDSFADEMFHLEDEDIATGKNQHACVECHSEILGKKSPPCTHFKPFGARYFNATAFPKSAELIAKLISECK